MFTIRAYHSLEAGGTFSTFPEEYLDQLTAESVADRIFQADSQDVDGPRFDCVCVLNDKYEIVYEKEA